MRSLLGEMPRRYRPRYIAPFVARYDYGFGGLLSFEGVDFLRGERHARIAECWGVEWEGESEAEIILYDCDDDALLLPRRIRMMRV